MNMFDTGKVGAVSDSIDAENDGDTVGSAAKPACQLLYWVFGPA